MFYVFQLNFKSIIQGTGEDQGCHNVTSVISTLINNNYTEFTNGTALEPIPLSPKFSVSIFFLVIFVFLLMSLIAFITLNCSSYVKIEKLIRRDETTKDSLTGEAYAKVELDDPVKINLSVQFKPIDHEESRREKFEKTLLFVVNFLITVTFFSLKR
jgi:hypothetical protein